MVRQLKNVSASSKAGPLQSFDSLRNISRLHKPQYNVSWRNVKISIFAVVPLWDGSSLGPVILHLGRDYIRAITIRILMSSLLFISIPIVAGTQTSR